MRSGGGLGRSDLRNRKKNGECCEERDCKQGRTTPRELPARSHGVGGVCAEPLGLADAELVPLCVPFPLRPLRARARNVPVCDCELRATCSGVPAATTRPPSSPPSGPRSIIQSADFITSRLCSMINTEAPPSMSLRKDVSSF